jgi:hypothetical protein
LTTARTTTTASKRGASVRWTPATVGAAVYYVQVVGDFPYETGQYALMLSSASSFTAEKVDGA